MENTTKLKFYNNEAKRTCLTAYKEVCTLHTYYMLKLVISSKETKSAGKDTHKEVNDKVNMQNVTP